MSKTSKRRQKTSRNLILLLLISIIMLGTSTYAWFTANKVVTINSIDVKVEASNGLQISTDANKWKSIITNVDIASGYTDHKNQLPSYVTAVSTDGTVDSTKAQLKMYKGTVATDQATGNYTLTTSLENEAAGSTGNFVAFDVFLRVDSAKTIYLTSQSNVYAKEGTEDKGLKNSARVAFVKLGNAVSTASTAQLIALKNPAAKAIIWEPNIDTHSDLVSGSVAGEYGVTLVAGSNTPYYGVNKEIGTPVDLKELVNGTNTTDASLVTPNITTKSTNTEYKKAFDLPAGVTKMRIYMWIEGQDIDCENNATGSDISYNLQFSTQSSGA